MGLSSSSKPPARKPVPRSPAIQADQTRTPRPPEALQPAPVKRDIPQWQKNLYNSPTADSVRQAVGTPTTFGAISTDNPNFQSAYGVYNSDAQRVELNPLLGLWPGEKGSSERYNVEPKEPDYTTRETFIHEMGHFTDLSKGRPIQRGQEESSAEGFRKAYNFLVASSRKPRTEALENLRTVSDTVPHLSYHLQNLLKTNLFRGHPLGGLVGLDNKPTLTMQEILPNLSTIGPEKDTSRVMNQEEEMAVYTEAALKSRLRGRDRGRL